MIKAFAISLLLSSFIVLSACGVDAKPPIQAEPTASNHNAANDPAGAATSAANNTSTPADNSTLTPSNSNSTSDGGNASSHPAQSEEPKASSTTDPLSFKAKLDVDFTSIESELTENEIPALEVLKNNLNALVNHDHAAFKAGFVTEKLAEDLDFYYGDHFQYSFTELELFERHTYIENQVHFTIVGEKLNTDTNTIEAEKLMYAIRQDDQGNWTIYTID